MTGGGCCCCCVEVDIGDLLSPEPPASADPAGPSAESAPASDAPRHEVAEERIGIIFSSLFSRENDSFSLLP